VDDDGVSADLSRRGREAAGVEVVDHDSRATGDEAGGEGLPDATGGPGDDDSGVLHRLAGHSIAPDSFSPPSATTISPVIQEASSDSRKATRLPMSSGSPSRLSG